MTQAAASARLPLIEAPGARRRRELGVLTVKSAAGRATLPLARVEVAARVADRIAGVTVTETFRNPHKEHLEAVYVFPLPGGAAVSDFEMKVGARTIKGKVEERGEARRQYAKAVEDGKRAALLEQERDDVFTVQVGNLPPGEEVSVRIVYSERLSFFEDGTTELRLPLVVAPRYIPGAPLERESVGEGVELDTAVVPDASRITPPRLAPGLDPNVGLAIEVELVGAASVRDLSCSQHATRTSMGAGGVTIRLAQEDERLDRDFVLRWSLAGEAVRSALLVHRAGDGPAYGALSITPPRREGFLGVPRDVVFVVDRSGSMAGVKMASAARACSILLATLAPNDRFAIQAFDDHVEWLGAEDRFVRADEAGIERGEKFLRSIASRGGTELDAALGAALEAIRARRDAGTRIPVVVLLTDGQVGDESRILKRIQEQVGDARVFTVGIDTAVNEGFLRRLAALGGGTSTFVAPGVGLEEALVAIGREIGSPLVVDLTVEDVDAGLDRATVTPSRIPDLFSGRAATVFFAMKRPGRVRVKGRLADGGAFEEMLDASELALPAIAHLWARARVADLEDRFRLEPASQAAIKKEIVELAVRHTLLTRFTAFVVVDESEIVNAAGERRKIVQPVEMPARWEMDESAAVTRGLPAGAVACMSMPAPAAPGAPPPPPPGKFRSAAPAPGAAPEASLPARRKSLIGGSIGGAFAAAAGKISEAFKSYGGGASGGPPSKEGARPEAASAPGLSPSARRELENAIEDLARALRETRTELAAGRKPAPDAIERTRAQLVKVLGRSEIGTRMPAMQRFLRSAAVEIVAALGSGMPTAALLELLDRHGKTFEEARKEASDQIRAAPTSEKGAFWESTV